MEEGERPHIAFKNTIISLTSKPATTPWRALPPILRDRAQAASASSKREPESTRCYKPAFLGAWSITPFTPFRMRR